MQRTVLLADNDAEVQETFDLAFANQDVGIVIVEDGDAALQKAATIQPDLVLVSLDVPGMSGYELCDSIKRECRFTAALLLAGPKDGIDLERARRARCDGYLVKPFDARTLIEAVEALLSRSSRLRREGLSNGPSTGAADSTQAIPSGPALADRREAARGTQSKADGPTAAWEPQARVERPETDVSQSEQEAKAASAAPQPSGSPAPPLEDVQQALETVAREAFQEFSKNMLDEVLDRFERIAWEVIPEMAEIALRKEDTLRTGKQSLPPGQAKKRP